MIKDKMNSVKSGRYTFKPKEYDSDDNLVCYIYRRNSQGKNVTKLIGTYLFDEDKFEINWIENSWILNRKHKDLIIFFLNEYNWKIKSWKINYFIYNDI